MAGHGHSVEENPTQASRPVATAATTSDTTTYLTLYATWPVLYRIWFGIASYHSLTGTFETFNTIFCFIQSLGFFWLQSHNYLN